MSKKILLLKMLLLFAGLALCSAPARSAERGAESLEHAGWGSAQVQPALKRQSVLFKVSKQGQTSYLFGTIHVGAKSFYPLPPEVSQALAGASQLVLELDTRANEAYQRALVKHANYPPGARIQDHVSADTMARLTAALHGVGVTVASVSHLKPWLLANFLMGLELERSGFERSNGNEVFLLAQAQARGTKVAELESADYQLALFDTMGDADAERYLREALVELSDGTSLRKAKATIAAWTSGNHAALDALIPDAVNGGRVMSDFTRRILLGKRNPEMAESIEGFMQGGKTTFVGVGLLHLLGADGLPRLLSQRGFQVDRVY